MADATTVRVTFRLRPGMLLRAHWVVTCKGKRTPIYAAILVLSIVTAYANRSAPDFGWMLAVFAIAWALILGGLTLGPWMHFRGLVKEPNFAGECELTADEDAIRARNGQIESRFEWSSFTRLFELKDLLVLRIGKKHMMVIPEDAFETRNDLARFRDLVNRKIAG